MSEIRYDDSGRPLVRYCPLCGVEDPGGIWGGEHTAATSCRECGANVLIDVASEVRDA